MKYNRTVEIKIMEMENKNSDQKKMTLNFKMHNYLDP